MFGPRQPPGEVRFAGIVVVSDKSSRVSVSYCVLQGCVWVLVGSLAPAVGLV